MNFFLSLWRVKQVFPPGQKAAAYQCYSWGSHFIPGLKAKKSLGKRTRMSQDFLPPQRLRSCRKQKERKQMSPSKTRWLARFQSRWLWSIFIMYFVALRKLRNREVWAYKEASFSKQVWYVNFWAALDWRSSSAGQGLQECGRSQRVSCARLWQGWPTAFSAVLRGR